MGAVWQNLRTIAVLQLDSFTPVNVPKVHVALTNLKARGPSFTQLRILQYLITTTNNIDHLKEIVDIEPYSFDWPNPFLV